MAEFPFLQEEEPEEDDGGEKKHLDAAILAKLMKSRTIVLAGEVNKRLAEKVVGQLLVFQEEDSDEPVKLFINSPGGDVDAGYAIFDMLRFMGAEVKAVAAGLCASAAVIVLLGAQKKNRYSLPNSRFLLHQPSSGYHGFAADIQIEASEIMKIRDKINRLIADETGQSAEKVESDTRRNFWMSPEEAKKYGLVGKVIESRTEL